MAHESHQQSLASLVAKALKCLPAVQNKGDGNVQHARKVRKPDFVTVTRGPGMRPSLTTGLDTAKGLSVAWGVPLVGVNHMQAHALTPRLVRALDAAEKESRAPEEENHTNTPSFPFLTLLVSGGHTMLVYSKALCDHQILASTTDIAIGDVIDKCARDILPQSYLDSASDVMYGRLLEDFTFPTKPPQYDYTPPKSFMSPRHVKEYDWTFNSPYSSPGDGGAMTYANIFSYSGIGSKVKRIMTTTHPDLGEAGRRILAREAMTIAFEHLASRVLFALERPEVKEVNALVVSGGVASNQFLKTILRTILDANGYKYIDLVFPPPKFCTDNAAMIAWTGMEMYEAGYRTSLRARAIRKWSIDPNAEDAGILGADEWSKDATSMLKSEL